MTTPEAQLVPLLYDACALLEDSVAAALADAGFEDIRPLHVPAFQAAGSLDAPTVTSMAALTGVTKQHMSQLVLELERLGYLERTVAADARRKVVRCTRRGVAAIEAADAATRRVHEAWRSALGAKGVRALVSGLQALVESAGAPHGSRS